jgi:tRNA-uridine 2-sulfurtransferase
MKKALVLYSGGLDSRLAVRLLQDQDFEITALYFALPFGCGCCDLSCNFHFTQKEKVKMIILDVNKEPLLSEYLKILKKPKFGTGAGINPCKDCKIFMFKKATEYAGQHNIEVIATGEVIGQRPMSQIPSAMKTIDNTLGFEILRPLSAKLLPETSFEKNKLVNRKKLLDISGRSRKKQMALAEKYKIKYPSPGGGCFLCEKSPATRLKHLLKNNLITEETLPLTMIGRHFYINKTWFVVARDEKESQTISKFTNHIKDDIGKPAIFMSNEKGTAKALELQNAYSTGDNEAKRKKFNKHKL